MKRLAIFASGKGTNAREIIKHFQNDDNGEVCLLISNNFESGLIDIAREFDISCFVFNNELLEEGVELLERLQSFKIDYVILAGFLRKIPERIIEAYPQHIINIHPALLPKFGGKGMYGKHVHQAVVDAKEKETGITIHLVNQNYDEGKILAQHKIELPEMVNANYVMQLVQQLEHQYYPLEISKYIAHV